MLLATTSALAFLAFLNATVLNVALPDLARAFDGDADLVKWTVTGYATALTAVVIAGGRLADAAGRRKILALGTALLALASLGGALAGSAAVLVVARTIQGAAAALITPASFGLLLEATPVERRTRAIGVWSSAAATSAFVGPPLGGLMVDLAGWRAPLAFSAAGALALIGPVCRLPRLREPSGSLPAMRGVIVGGAAVVALVLATIEAEHWGWSDPRTVIGAAAGAVGLGLGVLGVGGASWRILDPALLHQRDFAAATALSIVFGFAAFSWLLACPLFAATVWGWGALGAALSVAPGAAFAAVTATIAGRLPGRGQAWAIVIGGVLLAGTTFVLVGALDRSPRLVTLWLPAGIIAGSAIGGVLASLSAIVATSVPTQHFAQGAGINMTARQLGGALGVAAVGVLIGASGGPDPSRFTAPWLAIGIASAITAVGGAGLLRGKLRDERARHGTRGLGRSSSVTLET
jgi:MFS family permease